MGFLNQYQDRGPTAREVFELQARLRDAMRYDPRRDVAPERTLFTAPWHVEDLKRALVAVGVECVVLGLSGDARKLRASVLSGLVFVLDNESEPACISWNRVPELVDAVAAGESPVAAVVQLVGERANA